MESKLCFWFDSASVASSDHPLESCAFTGLYDFTKHQALPRTCHLGLAKGYFKGHSGSLVVRHHVSPVLGTGSKVMSS